MHRDEISAPQQLHHELLSMVNRYGHEADLSLCEVLGVLRLVEEDILEKIRKSNRSGNTQ
jgi:hypothetical protein